MARKPVRHWMNHMMIDRVNNSTGEMNGPIGHSLTGKSIHAWSAAEYRDYANGQNRKVAPFSLSFGVTRFHIHSLLSLYI